MIRIFNRKYSKKTMLLISEIIISFLGLLTFPIKGEQEWFIAFFIISLLQLILHIFYLYNFEKKIISFPIFFILLSYVFNFGHLPIKAFGKDFGKNVLFPLWYIKFDIYKKAAFFTLLSQMMLVLGIIFIYRFLEKKGNITLFNKGKNISLKKIKIIGLVCVCIGILPTLYIEVSKFLLFMQGGYLNTFNLQVHDFVETVADFFNFGIFALVIGFSNEKRKANIIFFVTVVYKVVMMSCGGRGEAIVFLLGLFIVWEKYVVHLSKKQIIALCFIGYAGLVLLNFIASARNITSFNMKEIFDIFVYSLSNNQLIATLSEFGSTFATVCFTIKSNPSQAYGLNYILPILLVIPNIGGFNSGVVDKMIFTKHIYTYKQPIGGSYIAELFYSYHWFGWLFAFVLGILIGFIAYQLVYQNKHKNYFLYLLFAYTMPLLFFWIRGYFGAVYRTYIWHCGFTLIIVFFMKYYQTKKKGLVK